MIAMRGQEPGFVLIKFLYETPVKTYSSYECFIAKSLRYALSFLPHVASISFRANCLKLASSSCHN